MACYFMVDTYIDEKRRKQGTQIREKAGEKEQKEKKLCLREPKWNDIVTRKRNC